MDGQNRANLKRRRPEAAKEDLGARLSGKLHHELHEVYHACKKAKAFETQKLVKRLKQLRTKGDEPTAVEDHESQLNSIKAIDHNRLGNSAFRSKILKDKLLRDNKFVLDALTKEIQSNVLNSPAAGTPLAKIQSRLLSSKIIASQVSTSLGALKSIIDPDTAPLTKRLKSSEPSTSTLPPNSLPHLADQVRKGSPSGSEFAESENADHHLGWESGTVDGDEDDEEDESEEAPGDGWESGSIHGSDEEAEHDDDDSSGDEQENVNAKSKKPSKPVATTSGTSSKGKMESTFLPSLAVGFVPGSDDSDVEGEGYVAEPRKNRRGQRARRAIWEKKYGRNANHKKKEVAENEKKARMEAWSRVRKTQTRSSDRGPQRQPQRKIAHAEGPKAPTPSTLKKDKDKGDKPLHPSWEAKRKLKEKQSDAIIPSQGKKIKF